MRRFSQFPQKNIFPFPAPKYGISQLIPMIAAPFIRERIAPTRTVFLYSIIIDKQTIMTTRLIFAITAIPCFGSFKPPSAIVRNDQRIIYETGNQRSTPAITPFKLHPVAASPHAYACKRSYGNRKQPRHFRLFQQFFHTLFSLKLFLRISLQNNSKPSCMFSAPVPSCGLSRVITLSTSLL